MKKKTPKNTKKNTKKPKKTKKPKNQSKSSKSSKTDADEEYDCRIEHPGGMANPNNWDPDWRVGKFHPYQDRP